MLRGAHLVLWVQGEQKSNGQGGSYFQLTGKTRPLPPAASLNDPKSALRAALKARRSDAAGNRKAPDKAAELFLGLIDPPKKAVIALYHAISDELSTIALADRLSARGNTLALPVVTEKDAPLIFRRYSPGDPLTRGAFNIMEPDAEARVLAPDIIVAPLLGFDPQGGRLGYGGGFYDRTLAQLRNDSEILAVGFGFAAQKVDALPLSPLDQRLNAIVTEHTAYFCDDK